MSIAGSKLEVTLKMAALVMVVILPGNGQLFGRKWICCVYECLVMASLVARFLAGLV